MMLTKFFYQTIRPFLTTQPIHFILKDESRYAKLLGIKPISSFIFKTNHPSLVKVDVNERIVEIPFVFQSITKKNARVLDIGCCESTVALSLATLGHDVTGLDIRPYHLEHPNFSFVQEDIAKTSLPNNHFDYVILLSTLEHIGLETIYGKVENTTDDQAAIDQVHALLKTDGKLLLTVPYSKTFFFNSFLRSYAKPHLKTLMKNFVIEEQRYYAPQANRKYWSEVKETEVPDYPEFGVTTIVARKK